VLKADCSWGGHGVRMAGDLRQAEEFFGELSSPLSTLRFLKRLTVDRDPYWLQTWRQRTQPAVIVQSQIQGRPANSAAVCWKGEVLAGIAAEVVNAQGVTGSATIVRIVDRPEMLLPAERLARRLGLSGFFGFDFMIEEQTGNSFLIEMNPRCTPLSHLQLGHGRDLIAALCAQLSQAPLRERTPVTTNDTIAYFPQAWHWDPSSPLLQSSFHDVPSEEPELVRELLLLPWPDRGALARLTNVLRRTRFRDRTQRGGVFDSAAANGGSPEAHPAGSMAAGSSAAGSSAIVALSAEGTKPPLFLIHGVDGTLGPFQDLVRHLEPGQPIFGVVSQALLGETMALTGVEELAAYYIQAIQTVCPHGPYHFLGYSFGGMLAFEMARQLRERGEPVGMLAMLDNLRMGVPAIAETPAQRLRRYVVEHCKLLMGPRAFFHLKEEFLSRILKPTYRFLRARRRPIPRFLRRTININWFAGENYVPQFYPGSITLFQARASAQDPGVPNDLWSRLAGEGVQLHYIPGGHEDVLKEPNVGALAQALTDCLANFQRGTQAPSSALSAGGGVLGRYLRDSSVASPQF
jgi:thioesterase domain-containing protein